MARPKFMAKYGKIVIACLIVLMAGGAFIFWKIPRGGDGRELILYGNVDIRQVELAFRVGGRLAETLVEEGESVEPNQPLARLEGDILRQQRDEAAAALAQQEANLKRLEKGYRAQEIAQARAAVAAAQAGAENARLNLDRIAQLRKSNASSQKELDNASAAQREAAASLRSANENLQMLLSGYREEEIAAQKAVVDSARAALEKAEIGVRDGTLYAPQKGIILTRAREAGAIVSAGQTVYTLTLVNPVWLRAYISEPDLGKVKPGMPVRVAVDAWPGRFFEGSVGFISPVAEFTPKTVETKEVRTSLVYRARILAQDPENVMRQGMPVTIFIDTASQ